MGHDSDEALKIMSATHPTILDFEDGRVHPNRLLTEEEFVAWCDEETRAEWVDGEVVMMSPVNRDHSDLVTFLVAVARSFVDHHDLGRVFGPEFQVRLDAKTRRTPDLLFVSRARESIILPTHVAGAPDLIMEVVSPESEARDWREKFLEYQSAGVREYWVMDRYSEHVEAYLLADGRYRRLAPDSGAIKSVVIPGFFLRLDWLWSIPSPKIPGVLRELGVIP